MKTIRKGTFETNSSSTHSITMCMESEYEKWKAGEIYYLDAEGVFVTPEKRKEILREFLLEDRFAYNYNGLNEPSTYTYKGVTVDWNHKRELFTKENLEEITDEEIENFAAENFNKYEMPCSYNQYYDNIEYETYKETFTTPKGEKVVSFGYYGQDY